MPTEVSTVSHDISDYHILIHGEKKIGKTTLAMTEPNTLLLNFDPPQLALAILQVHIPDWNHFIGYLQLLEAQKKAGKLAYKRIVLDGADIWYRRCQEWACKKLAVDHPADAGWGKGWDLLKESFAKALERITALGVGCWFISHSKWTEIETRKEKRKISKLLPLIKQGGEEILVGKVDGWFAYDYSGRERVLIVRGDERTGAGNRIKGHFLTPNRLQVREIPMGNSEEQAYANLLKAFNNQQTFTVLGERPVAKPISNGKGVFRQAVTR